MIEYIDYEFINNGLDKVVNDKEDFDDFDLLLENTTTNPTYSYSELPVQTCESSCTKDILLGVLVGCSIAVAGLVISVGTVYIFCPETRWILKTKLNSIFGCMKE